MSTTTAVTDDIALVEIAHVRDAAFDPEVATAVQSDAISTNGQADHGESMAAVEAEHEYPTGWR